jgi:RNA recognition motif-containing protein
MNSKLFVGNLSYSTTEEELRELFSQAGAIKAVTIPMDRTTDRPRGFAFVEMESPAEAQKAITLCNGQMLSGRQINVNEARPPEARTSFGGGNGGGNREGGRDFSRDGNDRRGGRPQRRF